jgi:25S rRNA (adenine2142-N1)-methyltransferase
MGTRPKRKKPITAGVRSTTTAKQSLKGTSHKVTQAVIQRFHVLLKRKSVLERDLKQAVLQDANVISIEEQLKAVSEEIDSLGGLDAYQEASTLGQDKERGGDSSKVLIEWLKELNESYRSCEPAKTDGQIQKRPMRWVSSRLFDAYLTVV